MTRMLLCGLVALFQVLAVPFLAAQDPNKHNTPLERGFSADKAYQVGDIDSVDLATGNVITTIPIG